jgi:hypothetical protein
MEIIWERITRSDFPPILSLLLRSSVKESADSPDQIFDIVGISDRKDEPDFQPDYSLTLHQTYGKAFKSLIKGNAEGPSLLYFVGLPTLNCYR